MILAERSRIFVKYFSLLITFHLFKRPSNLSKTHHFHSPLPRIAGSLDHTPGTRFDGSEIPRPNHLLKVCQNRVNNGTCPTFPSTGEFARFLVAITSINQPNGCPPSVPGVIKNPSNNSQPVWVLPGCPSLRQVIIAFYQESQRLKHILGRKRHL